MIYHSSYGENLVDQWRTSLYDKLESIWVDLSIGHENMENLLHFAPHHVLIEAITTELWSLWPWHKPPRAPLLIRVDLIDVCCNDCGKRQDLHAISAWVSWRLLWLQWRNKQPRVPYYISMGLVGVCCDCNDCGKPSGVPLCLRVFLDDGVPMLCSLEDFITKGCSKQSEKMKNE